MATELPALRPEAITRLSQIIGDTHTGAKISDLFRRSGFPHLSHDGGTKWRFVAAALEQLQRQAGDRPNTVLHVIETFCNPQTYFGRREIFDPVLKAINEVLAFYGLRITEEGKTVSVVERATTVRREQSEDEKLFDARRFHTEVQRHGRSLFTRGAYFHAVFECCKALGASVQKNSGISKSGQPLMAEALSLSGPVKLNSQQAQSERDEQE